MKNSCINAARCMCLKPIFLLGLIFFLVFAVAYWDVRFIAAALYVHFLALVVEKKCLFARVMSAYAEKDDAESARVRKAFQDGASILFAFYIGLAVWVSHNLGDLTTMGEDEAGGYALLFLYAVALILCYFFIQKMAEIDGGRIIDEEMRKIQGHRFALAKFVRSLFNKWSMVFLAILAFFAIMGLIRWPISFWLLQVPFCFFMVCKYSFSAGHTAIASERFK